MVERKIKKLPLVDKNGVLAGLITAKDIIKQKRLPFATRDAQGRLRVGAAIGATGDYLERAAELIRRRCGCDRDRHRARPLDRDGSRDRGVPQALRRLRADRRQRRDGRRRALSGGARRERHQGGHRSGRRLRDAADHELRRAAAAGAGRMPIGDAGRQDSVDRGWRHQAAWQHHGGAAVRRRFGDARQRVRRHARKRPARSSTSRWCCRSRRKS